MDSIPADSRRDRHLMRQRGAGFGTRELKFADFGFKICSNENSSQNLPAVLANAPSEPEPVVDPADPVPEPVRGPTTKRKRKAPEKWFAADELTGVSKKRRGRPAKLATIEREMQGRQLELQAGGRTGDTAKRTRETTDDEAPMLPKKRRGREARTFTEASGQRQGREQSLSKQEEAREDETGRASKTAFDEDENVPKKRRGRPKKSEIPSNLEPENKEELGDSDVKLEDRRLVRSRTLSVKTKKNLRKSKVIGTASVEVAESRPGEAVAEEQITTQGKEQHIVRASEAKKLKSEPQGIVVETNSKKPGRAKRQKPISHGLDKPVMSMEEERTGYVSTNINAAPEQVSDAGTLGPVNKRKQGRPTIDRNGQAKVLKLATSRRIDDEHQEGRDMIQARDSASGIALAHLANRVERKKNPSEKITNGDVRVFASSAIRLVQEATGADRRASKGETCGTASKSHLSAKLQPPTRPPLSERASNALEESKPSKRRQKASKSGDWEAPDWFKASVPTTLVRSNDSRLHFRF